jgi:hypothetical protein
MFSLEFEYIEDKDTKIQPAVALLILALTSKEHSLVTFSEPGL